MPAKKTTTRTAPKKPIKRSRNTYSPAFRDEALKLAELSGVSAAARELDVDKALIYNWRRVHRVDRAQSEIERSQAAEIARLKRELAEREEELEILGKAQAYFARKLK